MLEDIDGPVEIQKRIQGIAGGILRPVFAANTVAKAGICLDAGFQLQDAAKPALALRAWKSSSAPDEAVSMMVPEGSRNFMECRV